MHLLATVRTGDCNIVDIRAVKFDVIRAVRAHLFEFFDAAYGVFFTAFTFPNVKRGTPISVSGNAPILYVCNPRAETACAYRRRNPVDCIIVFYKVVTNCRHLDKPRFSCVVDKRCVTAPAVRVAVLKFRGGEKCAGFFQVFQNLRVGIFNKHTFPFGFFCHLTLAVYKLNKRQVVLSAYIGVVLAECRCNVNDTCTVFCGYIACAGYKPALFSWGYKVPKRHILSHFKSLAFHFFQNFVFALT